MTTAHLDRTFSTTPVKKGRKHFFQGFSEETASLAQGSSTNGVSPANAFGSGTPTATVGATGINNVNALLGGTKWLSTTVTFSFTDNFANDYEAGYANAVSHASSFQTLSTSQRAVSRTWFGQYGAISGLNLVELTGASDRDATLRIARSNNPGTAYAYYPNSFYSEGGDIWFNNTSYNSPTIGNYAFHTFGHEFGHALGLKHGQEVGGVANLALSADRDSMEFSVMTYRSYVGHNLTTLPYYTNETWGFAQSLMMYDIRAIQAMYGANFTTNATNSVYRFSTTTGEMSINGVGQGVPGANRIFRTIWDGNGIDTYDFSNYTTNLAVDLTPGGWTDLNVGGNAQRAMLNAGYGGITQYARGHIFNALQYNGDVRSLIENAYGGSGNDRIIGNAGNNALIGNAGNDVINGGTGRDTTSGGLGNDRIIDDDFVSFDNHDGGLGIDTIDYSTVTFATGLVTINLGTGLTSITGGNQETITNFENVEGSQGGETIIGSTANNVLRGNAGNDVINGGAGLDTLSGGIGNDTFVFQFGQSLVNAFDRITDFTVGIDKIDLLTASGGALPTPTAFSRAADSLLTSLTTLVTQVFTDANGAISGNQALGTNSAALVRVTSGAIAGTYLMVNDGVAGFQSASDLLINITGVTGTLPGLGTITPSTFFV